ncbi:uncharacterized protein LOC120284120 [Dioscorea cayenensis subsp. rotundata]|uniref:Uncharacterized protein LOC120284120 n=1 Tax=Dioscorea cayennensis subsp. rotundata TaxID=55577 RepID=A0AB40D3G4_DIOCR|nr:uncharacterized protein LOC120284120 [Dioscorea cayenensis subsp. rotundata]
MAGKEGASVTRPPLLDGSNYPYWKARMKVFIKSLDENTWTAVEEGWSPLIEVDENMNETVKIKSNWSSEDMLKANANGKALNAIFGGVDENQFKMGEDEMIAVFNAKLMDIANQAYHLGKEYSDKKLVRKTLRSLPRRFDAKEEDKAEDAVNTHTSLPTDRDFRNFSAFASLVTTSIATPGEIVCEEVTETDLLHGYELMLNKLDEMVIQNKQLAKELKECQEKLNIAEKPINNMNKGRAKIEKVPFQTSVTQHHIEETSRGKKSKVEAGCVLSNAQENKQEKYNKKKRQHRRQVPICFHCGKRGHIRPECYQLKEEVKKDRIFGKAKKWIPTCHYCGVKGHIRPRCWKMKKDIKGGKSMKQTLYTREKKKESKKIWVKKEDLVGYSSIKKSSKDNWYFDSGCSRHMTGDKGFLMNYKECQIGHVTFGDGQKG